MKRLIFITLLFFCSRAEAQKAGNIWYFGMNAGLDFNGVNVVPLSNGALSTSEGCSSYSDPATGQILVYTDGITVYGKNHLAMPGSLTTPLAGNPSSTQSGVIIPKPGDPNIIYVFTTPAQTGSFGISSLCYSIVDLTLNGGNGDLTSINVPLIDTSSEKIAAISTCNGTEFWIVGHKWNCDTFYAFKLSASGISAPVKSKTGIVHEDIGSMNDAESIGYLKFSSDGKKLGSVCYTNLNVMEIFDFDMNTGIVSNPITDNFGWSASNPYSGLYGCSFSPDNSRFYVSYFGSGDASEVYQYNMNAGSPAAILASKTLIHSSLTMGIGALQNGPNGKLYVCVYGANNLDVINSPNALGAACNYQTAGQSIGTAMATFGLPVIVENFLSSIPTPINLAVTDSICEGDTVVAVQPVKFNFTISPASSCSVSSDSLTITFFPKTTTTYTIVISNKCSSNDTTLFTVHVLPPPNPNFLFNPSNPTLADNTITLVNQTTGGSTYNWYDMQQTNIGVSTDLVLTNPGLGKFCYRLEAFNAIGCSAEITKCVTVEDTLVTSIFVPTAFSPNGDGLNDIIRILGQHVSLSEFSIYNRFGEQLFTTYDITEGWNGKYKGNPCDIGSYYYMVYYFDTKSRPRILKGDVSLIR